MRMHALGASLVATIRGMSSWARAANDSLSSDAARGPALRPLKDAADQAARRGDRRRAATLLARVAAADPDPYWSHRAGEALLRVGDERGAREQLERAVNGYRTRGHEAKARAVAKMMVAVGERGGAGADAVAAVAG